MEKMKAVDSKLLYELMKNSRRSDRELAKVLGISQPTVSRRRIALEKNFIDDIRRYQNGKKSVMN